MRLLVQPGDSITQLVKGIESAKKSVEIVIFRIDRREIERALKDAVNRGVFVHALIARTNRGGEENLRRLEMRLLEAGITVARTPDDLLRYHYKIMIIDRRLLYLLAFNFTYLDIEHSRSFGVITRNRKFVQEAIKLFETDTRQQHYVLGFSAFIVSPVNARERLGSFIRGAKKQLLIYDLRISDTAMIRLLEDRAKAGVEVRIIGRLDRCNTKLDVRRLARRRLHTRTMVRDGRLAFIGSQSLREVELDGRREVGLIFRESKVVPQLTKIFEQDWAEAVMLQDEAARQPKREPLADAAKKVAKAIANDLPPVTPVLEQAVKDAVGDKVEVQLDSEEIEETVQNAVKKAVKEAVKAIVEGVGAENGSESAQK